MCIFVLCIQRLDVPNTDRMKYAMYHVRKENNEKMPSSEREMMEMQAEDMRIRTLYKER